jgi:hypothetical protein
MTTDLDIVGHGLGDDLGDDLGRLGSRRRVASRFAAGAAVLAVLAALGGAQLGRALTSDPGGPARSTVPAWSFPSDWQAYRSGERGDGPGVGSAVVYPSDWRSYRAGER